MGFLDDIPGGGTKKKRHRQDEIEPEDILVRYTRIKCPKCHSYRVPVYCSRNLPVRYHKCEECGLRFKSVEEL